MEMLGCYEIALFIGGIYRPGLHTYLLASHVPRLPCEERESAKSDCLIGNKVECSARSSVEVSITHFLGLKVTPTSSSSPSSRADLGKNDLSARCVGTRERMRMANMCSGSNDEKRF